MDIDKLKNIVQDCNINFLFASGMSAPYLRVLGNIEILLGKVSFKYLLLPMGSR